MSQARESFWEERGHHWTHEQVVEAIKRLHRAGRRLRRKRIPVKLYSIGRRLFGSWRVAVETAGFNYEDVSGIHRWDRNRVIAEIRQLAAAGVPLSRAADWRLCRGRHVLGCS